MAEQSGEGLLSHLGRKEQLGGTLTQKARFIPQNNHILNAYWCVIYNSAINQKHFNQKFIKTLKNTKEVS
jgi:hypothetical protein